MASLVCGIFFFEIIKDVPYPQSVATDFIGICWSDAFTSCSHLVFAFRCFYGSIEQAVSGHDEMSFLRDVQPFTQVVPAFFKFLGFSHKQVWCKHNTVAYDVYLPSLKDAGRNTSQHIFLPLELECVTGIGTTLKTCNHIVAWC